MMVQYWYFCSLSQAPDLYFDDAETEIQDINPDDTLSIILTQPGALSMLEIVIREWKQHIFMTVLESLNGTFFVLAI